MSKKLIYLLLAISLGLNVGVITTTLVHHMTRIPPTHPTGPPSGKGREPGPPPDPGQLVERHVQGITRHLKLDSDRQQAIRAVLEHHAPQLVRFQANVTVTSRRLPEAYAAPVFDPEQFQQLTAEASAARARLDSLSAVMLVAEAAAMTPEQRRKFAEVAPSIYSTQRRPPAEGRPPSR